MRSICFPQTILTFSPKFWPEYFGEKSKMCWQMFAVLANIFNFGVVELFLQKVEFLHEIFLFFPHFS